LLIEELKKQQQTLCTTTNQTLLQYEIQQPQTEQTVVQIVHIVLQQDNNIRFLNHMIRNNITFSVLNIFFDPEF
jgi:hypothetical protein